MVSITAVAAAAVAGTLLGAFVLTGYRLLRAASRSQPLLMPRMMEHEGVGLEAWVDASVLRESGEGTRRCLLCRERRECVEWLEGRSERALAELCPNAELIQRMKLAPT